MENPRSHYLPYHEKNDLSVAERQIYWDRRGSLPGFYAVCPSDWNGAPEIMEQQSIFLSWRIRIFLQEVLQNDQSYHGLDVGCGFGRMSVGLTRAIPNVDMTAVDFSEIMCKKTEAFAFVMGVSDRVKVHQTQADTLTKEVGGPFQKESFDFAIAGALYIHLTDLQEWNKALHQVQDAVKEGGHVLIYEPMLDTNPQYRALPSGRKHGITQFRSIRDYDRVLNQSTRVKTQDFPYCNEQYTALLYRRFAPASEDAYYASG